MQRSRMTTWMCAAALLTAVGGCASTRELALKPFTQPEKDREVRFDFAQVAERDGNLPRAAEQYRALHKARPKDARFCHRLGVVCVRMGDPDEGLEHLKQAHDLDPKNLAILNDLGYAQLLQGDYAAAESTFRAALALDPRHKRSMNNLALAIGYDGRIDEAYSLFRAAGSEAEAEGNIGYVLAHRGDLDAAINRYHRSLSRDPALRSSAEALVQLTELKEQMRRLEQSEEGVQYAQGSAAPPAAKPPQRNQPAAAADDFRPVRLVNQVETDE